MNKYVIGWADGWEALYVDGVKVFEGDDAYEALAELLDVRRVDNQEYVDEHRTHPERLSDVR